MVKNDTDWSSDDSRASEDCGDLQGDLYVGSLGDEICVQKNNILRIRFQNVGGLPTSPGTLKEDNIWLGIKRWDSDGSTSTSAGLITEIFPQDKQDNMVVLLFSQLTRQSIES